MSRGLRSLRRVLREQTQDVRQLDEAGFWEWLDQHLARWRHDAVFMQRVRIRDLRRSCPSLALLERMRRRLAAEDAAAPEFTRLSRLEQELIRAGRAIEGLTAALEQAKADRRASLRRKLDDFRAKHQAMQAEQAALVRSSAARQALLRIERELAELRAALGLDREEARLAELLTERGRRGGRAGESFEREAAALTRREIVQDVARPAPGQAAGRIHVLQGVTLGAAQLELDQLVVRAPQRSGQIAVVLALVEVKRNINDLARGFHQRQGNLAWLTGETAGYDAETRRTRQFPSGHFDTEAAHHHEGEALVFTPQSFRLFRRDDESGLFLDRLYFITRRGPIWGLSSAALERISYRVATDEQWAPEKAAYRRRLWRWCRSLASASETPDILRAYAASPRRARNILIVGGEPPVTRK